MKHKDFISQLDNQRIVDAISAAESKTTGQLRVFISRKDCPDPLAAATTHFKALGMNKTPEHNAVLIFIAPKSRTFAIFGDSAIHERCGEPFWTALRDEMTTHLKESRYTDALVHALHRAGDLLAAHFPVTGPANNPLPNDIAHD